MNNQNSECNRLLYGNMTGLFLQSIMNDLVNMENVNTVTPESIDIIYQNIINSLLSSSDMAVPRCRKFFLSFGGTRSWMR